MESKEPGWTFQMYTGLIRDGLVIIQNRQLVATQYIDTCVNQSNLRYVKEGWCIPWSDAEKEGSLVGERLLRPLNVYATSEEGHCLRQWKAITAIRSSLRAKKHMEEKRSSFPP